MLTVLFATYNRGHLLGETLASFCRLRPPNDGFRLIAVDNRSDDDTRAVIESFKDKLPVNYLYEAKPGKSAAINRGLAHCEGDLIVFTDDDVIPRSDWLVNLEAGASTHREYDLFGGRILPRWEKEPPAWVVRAVPLRGNYALSAPEWKDGPIPAARIFGPNMACRKTVLDAGFRFDESIMTDGSATFPMGDETDFLVRAEQAGFRAWFVSDAVVEHMIPASNIEPRWLVRRAFRQGRGSISVFNKSIPEGTPIVFGCPRYLWRGLAEDGLEVAWSYLTLSRERILRARWKFTYRRGQVYQYRIASTYR